jgi:two-component system sensor histidine kinase AdeS
MLPKGLSRQLVISMSAVALGVTLFIHVSFYIFYAVAMEVNPAMVSSTPDAWPPTGPEWGWMIAVTLIGLTGAIYTASRLSRRILQPLNSVAESLRKLAHGDLDARAVAETGAMGETATLVADFNTMAERLQRMSSEFSTWNAAIAHELRTPVTILRGRLQGLAEGVFEPDPVQFHSLLTQVEGLSRLIEDLRVLSLADSGHLSLHLERCDLAAEILRIASLLEPELVAAGFRLRLRLEAAPVLCDVTRIRQIVLALLDNVRRYAQPGEITIACGLRSGSTAGQGTAESVGEGWEEGGETITRAGERDFVFQIEDDGPGVPDALLPHLFDPFYRGDDSRSRASGGSGLGLAVVRAVVQAHGGRIRCRRGSRGGALFEVELPPTVPSPEPR